MRIVQKYGGTSLGDLDKIRAAAQRIGRLAQQGAQVVVVVSAQADTTDTLLETATTINPRGSARELDAYLWADDGAGDASEGRQYFQTDVPFLCQFYAPVVEHLGAAVG